MTEKTVKQGLDKKINFENVLAAALKVPGVKINRAKFLKKELNRYCSETEIENAIETNPGIAGVPKDQINKISEKIINYETAKVTGISGVSSLPGGFWGVGAAATDIVYYFASIIRVAQKLAYIYGFRQFELDENDMDSETMSILIVFIGVMFGVRGASSSLSALADVFAKHISKTLARQALTKGTIYPIVKKVALRVGIKMTKQIFADTLASTIPILGGLASGVLTLAMFRPCCSKLRDDLMSYNLCDPEYYKE